MMKSNVLLLFNPPELERYLPGKLFDYIASNSNILVYGIGGEIENAINVSKAGCCIPIDNPKILAEALENFRYDREEVIKSGDRKKWLSQEPLAEINFFKINLRNNR